MRSSDIAGGDRRDCRVIAGAAKRIVSFKQSGSFVLTLSFQAKCFVLKLSLKMSRRNVNQLHIPNSLGYMVSE